MTIGRRIAAAFLGVTLFLTIGAMLSTAQEPAAKTKETPTTPPKKADSSRRVPSYFGQIGLTPEQRESIYKIRRTHLEKTDALKKQITATEAQSLAECEAVLNDTQRKLLKDLRSAPKSAPAAKTAK